MAAEKSDLSLSQQRDRFVAFAFAASDILFEVNLDGNLTYATGGLQSLLQQDEGALLGSPLSALALEEDSIVIEELLSRIALTGRVRDVAVRLAGASGAQVQVMVCGMKCPYEDGIVHLAVRRAPLSNAGAAVGAADSPVSKEQFKEQVAHYAEAAREAQETKNLTLYDFSDMTDDSGMDEPDKASMVGRLEKCLGAWSSGGTPAGKLDDGKYGVVLDADANADALGSRLGTIIADGDMSNWSPVAHASLDISDPVEVDRFEDALDFAIDGFLEEGPGRKELLSFAKCVEALERQEEMDRAAQRRPRREGFKEGWG